jgi:hypothetical protein
MILIPKVQGLDSSRHGHIAIETTKYDDHVGKKLRDSEGYHDGDRSSDDNSEVSGQITVRDMCNNVLLGK